MRKDCTCQRNRFDDNKMSAFFPGSMAHGINSRNYYSLGFCGQTWFYLTLTLFFLHIFAKLWIYLFTSLQLFVLVQNVHLFCQLRIRARKAGNTTRFAKCTCKGSGSLSWEETRSLHVSPTASVLTVAGVDGWKGGGLRRTYTKTFYIQSTYLHTGDVSQALPPLGAMWHFFFFYCFWPPSQTKWVSEAIKILLSQKLYGNFYLILYLSLHLIWTHWEPLKCSKCFDFFQFLTWVYLHSENLYHCSKFIFFKI